MDLGLDKLHDEMFSRNQVDFVLHEENKRNTITTIIPIIITFRTRRTTS